MLDPVTLIFIGIFIFVALRLRSVLGTRTGEEDKHAQNNRYRVPTDAANGGPANDKELPEPRAEDLEEDSGDNIVTLPNRDRAAQRINDAESENRERKIRKFAKPDSPLGEALAMLMSRDPNFEPAEFLKGAKMAYEMIVTAFADGDRATLKNLLAKDVYKGFESAIDDREDRGERVESSFVGVEKADFVEVATDADEAQVTLRFVSQLISTTRDSDGEIIDGDPQEVAEVKDVWTFARPLSSNDPNWKLIATEAEA
jgi:predicted lipid-binding transport protein (Tim44 family)